MDDIYVCYTSCGCNRVSHCADWGRNNLLCYGSCNGIVVYQPDGCLNAAAEVLCILNGHTDRVNCVRWISDSFFSAKCENELVSCSVDKTAILWKAVSKKCSQFQYEQTAVLRGHTGSVTVASTVYTPGISEGGSSSDRDLFIATGSSDSTVKCWRRKSKSTEVTGLQTLSFGTGFVLDIHLILIPETNVPLMACGVDDHKVHLFILQNDLFVGVINLSGHEDWVRGVHMTVDDCGDMLLASCSQDSVIRLWRLSKRTADTGFSSLAISDLAPEEDIKMKEKMFSYQAEVEKHYFSVVLESVLCGHDGWIYSVCWQPPEIKESGEWHQPLRLLSASMDKTMIVWCPDADSGVWLEQVRVGEVGGNTLGFYGAVFGPLGDSILAHGYQGALHQWLQNKETHTWEPAVTGGGHFAGVEDLDWEKGGGHFLLTTSADQTTRLHAPWVKNGKMVAWYEIARPQIHGYDMQCLTMINPYTFASAGDEKVIRVFQAPSNILQNLQNLCGLDLCKELANSKGVHLPEGASVPALGLSNKAVYGGSQSLVPDDRLISASQNEQYTEAYFTPLILTAPPSEEHLLQNMLWPEIHKLYGHGYEVFALASNPAGTLLASSCKAAKAEYANILLWDTSTWQRVASLEGCTLTVVQMAFSPSGRYLLAVSRDRTWSLYRCADGAYSRVSFVDKKTTCHSRIIWACTWSYDEQFFFTASRDNKVAVWNLEEVCHTQTPKPVSLTEMEDSVTAIDVASVTLPGHRYLVAMGLERGEVTLHTWNSQLQQGSGDTSAWAKIKLDKCHRHQQTVKRVKFRPVLGQAGGKQPEGVSSQWIQLASCGSDFCVKVHNIRHTVL